MDDNLHCRILLVPSSKELGLSLIKRVTNDSHSVPRDEEDKTDTQASKEETAEETVTKDRDLVPWTITNKYYTADVHFQLADWHNPAPSLKSGIPAIVVIWEKGEDYTAILGRYALEWERLRPEVLIAVTTGSQDIDVEKVESFCSEVGFEFVDADAEDETDDAGVPRVRGALQTIMWPSMQLKTKPKRASYARGHRSQNSIDRGAKETTATGTTDVGSGDIDPKYNLEKEKQQLEAWLDSDDPWPKRNPQDKPKADGDNQGDPSLPNPKLPDAFDDDFTEFVSAPANSAPHKTIPDPLVDSDPQASSDEEEKFHFDDEDEYKELFDEEMPTSEEIMLTSQRIFGPAYASREKAEPKLNEVGEGDEDEEDPGEFDLGSIMGALQNMKDEIAGITDEDAKRRAAATVALGLVWGLEGGRH